MASGRGDNINFDSPELSIIDSGIHSMRDVPLGPQLQSLNLHSNYIQRIEGLERLRNLHHLDLSANQIARISGLEGLVLLKTLNLSCNLIMVIEGVDSLRSLVKLNLSYNQIEDVSGLRSMSGGDYKLTQLELHGNKLRSMSHVQRSIMMCSSLRHLVLSQDGSSNPLCHHAGYDQELLSAVPQLETLNGVDRHGRRALPSDIMADVPELEAYLDFLMSGGSTSASTSSDAQQPNIRTPKIDEMLEKFRLRGFDPIPSSSATLSATDADSAPSSRAATPSRRKPGGGILKNQEKASLTATNQDARLADLEMEIRRLQLAQFKMKSGGSPGQFRSPAAASQRDTGDTEEETEPVRERGPARVEQRKLQQKKSNLGQGPPRQSSASSPQAGPTARKSAPRKSRPAGDSARKRAGGSDREDTTASGSRESTDGGRAAKADSDHRHREEMQSTYVQLLQELEGERERRWKAEQAARKLADHVKDLQTKHNEDSEMKTTAMEVTEKLKQSVMNEREVKVRLQDQVTSLQARVEDLEDQLRRAREAEDANRATARDMEGTLAQHERQRLQQQAHEAKKVQESELKAAALSREVDLLRGATHTQKGQIHQLQELLASREQQHREELSQRYRLDSKELQEVLQKEVQAVEKHHQQEMKTYQEKVDALSRQYSELEDEFRMALQIEAGRFREVQSSFERVNAENAENKALLLAAQKKDEHSSTMLTELTALVKEQKGRIAELSRAKQEQATQYRERVEGLEASVEEARKRMVQFELLKQENVRLQSTVHAQESVIQGLKAERRLWGQELAQQGASLSQDRGRLEIKIESLGQEVVTLKKQLEKETDLVRIKTKMVDDQTETIRKLKEGLLERDEQIRETREEALRVQRSLEEQLAEERTAHQDTQELLEDAQSRKSELKHQVSALQAELDSSQQAHQQLSARWKEKSELIGKLEKQVSEMQRTWHDKEKKLAGERDKSVEAARLAIEKMRSMDDAFRQQLESAEKSHREELARMTQEKQHEVDMAERKVVMVEEEMRELLRETEHAKRTLEEKVKRMTQALGDLQSDLF